jgi:hypothetical protein
MVYEISSTLPKHTKIGTPHGLESFMLRNGNIKIQVGGSRNKAAFKRLGAGKKKFL